MSGGARRAASGHVAAASASSLPAAPEAGVPAASAIAAYADAAGGELAAQGFPRVAARVLMAITAAEDGRLTAAELAETLVLSPAAVSGGIRYLVQLGFVRVATVPGTRRHTYSLTELPWYALSNFGDRSQRSAVALERAAALLPPGSAAIERAADMADFMRFCAERVPALMDEWRAERRAH